MSTLALSVSLACVLGASAKSPWDYLRAEIEGWPYTDGFALEVGDASGQLFLYERGNFTLDTRLETASTSKWPIATMFTNMVNDGVFPSLDVKASDVLDWWTTNISDPRSRVTLRNCLSFTSGFGGGKPGEMDARLGLRGLDQRLHEDAPCMDDPIKDYVTCGKQVYENVKVEGEPGTVFAYNSYHFKLAGAMAVTKTGMDIQSLVKKYLLEPFGMKTTNCMDGVKNPQLAVCLQTTGRDYSSFLSTLLNYKVIPKELTDQMELDYTPVPVMPAGPTLFGHYAFGHFYECFDSVKGFTTECQEAQVHCDPGAFGYYPLIDRKNKYYLQVVAYEHAENYNRSGIPEYLRLLAKPYGDMIMKGENPEGAARAQFGKLGFDDVSYIANCYANKPECY